MDQIHANHDPSFTQSPVELNRADESKLRLKIDFFIVPTVSLLYLFCFIDRANLGEQHLTPC